MKKTSVVDVTNSTIVERGGYAEILKQISDEGHCPFCMEYLQKHHNEPTLAESEYWLVTKNFKPYAGTREHFLFISKTHIERIEFLKPEEWQEFFILYSALCKQYCLEGSTLLWRSGETSLTGATVAHLHAQVIVGQKREADSAPITAVVGFKKNNE